MAYKNNVLANAPAKIFSEEEIAEKLDDYILISPEDYKFLQRDRHVRYIDADGKFQSGGFVHSNQKAMTNEKGRFLKMKNGFYPNTKGYADWVVYFKTIKRLYAKPTAGESTLRRENLQLARTLKLLVGKIRSLDI